MKKFICFLIALAGGTAWATTNYPEKDEYCTGVERDPGYLSPTFGVHLCGRTLYFLGPIDRYSTESLELELAKQMVAMKAADSVESALLDLNFEWMLLDRVGLCIFVSNGPQSTNRGRCQANVA